MESFIFIFIITEKESMADKSEYEINLRAKPCYSEEVFTLWKCFLCRSEEMLS